jgi:hypothetical protein
LYDFFDIFSAQEATK